LPFFRGYGSDPGILESTQYKTPWFAGHGSSAPAHIRISQRHWLSIRFSHTLFAFTPTFKFQLILISLSSNMRSYETLVVLALAFSTASPALSAPVRENQYQARANIDDPAVTNGLGDVFKSVLKTVGINGALGAATAAGEHFLHGGNSTRRAMSRDDTDLTPAVIRVNGLPVGLPSSNNGDDANTGHIFVDGLPVNLDQRAPAGIGGVLDDIASSSALQNIGKGVLGGLAGALGTFGVNDIFNHTRREPSPLTGAGFGKTLAGLAASLAASDGIKDLLNHTRREPSPLSGAGFGKTLAGLAASLAASDGIKDLLNHTRRDPEPASPLNLLNDALTLEQVIQPFLRRLAELD